MVRANVSTSGGEIDLIDCERNASKSWQPTRANVARRDATLARAAQEGVGHLGSWPLNESSLVRFLSLMDVTQNRFARPVPSCAWSGPNSPQRAHVSVATIRRLEGTDGSQRVTPATVEGIRQALEQAGAEFIPDGVRRRRAARANARSLYEDLRAISLRSAARLQGRELLKDADLYDENGLPA